MKFTTRELCRIGVFIVVSAVLSQISIPLPFTPVPISLGLTGTFVAGIFLSPRCALFSQIGYLALGATGLPIYAQFSGGLGVLVGPTGGYLMAYPLMAVAVSWAIETQERFAARTVGGETARKFSLAASAVVGMVLAMFICYTLGTSWLMRVMNMPLSRALALAVYPFIPLDIAKIAFTAIALLPVRSRVLGVAATRTR